MTSTMWFLLIVLLNAPHDYPEPVKALEQYVNEADCKLFRAHIGYEMAKAYPYPDEPTNAGPDFKIVCEYYPVRDKEA